MSLDDVAQNGVGHLFSVGHIFSVAGHHHKVLIAACLVGGGWWFLSQHEPSHPQRAETVSTVDAAPTVRPSRPVGERVQTPQPQTPEQEVAALHPYPATPTILLRPHQTLSTDPSRMRAFQNAMFDFETRTGKSFLSDHRSVQPDGRPHAQENRRGESDVRIAQTRDRWSASSLSASRPSGMEIAYESVVFRRSHPARSENVSQVFRCQSRVRQAANTVRSTLNLTASPSRLSPNDVCQRPRNGPPLGAS